MMLVDANLLLYSDAADLPEHEAARTWLDQTLRAGVRVGLPWQSLLAFMRIRCNPRVFERPLRVAEAWTVVEGWLDHDAVFVPTPGLEHRGCLARCLKHVTRAGLVAQAHLAALALEHDLTLVSADADFLRFKEVRCLNPLAG